MKKIGIFILLLFFWNGEGLKADIVARDSVITDMKTVINELLADTVDMAAVGQDTVAYIPQDSLSVLRDSISVEADSLLLEIDRAAIHFEDSIRHLKDSLMKAERAKKRIVPQEHPEVTAFKKLIQQYRRDYAEWEERWDDIYLQITGLPSDADFYKLSMPATYYSAPIEQSMSIEGWRPVIPFVKADSRKEVLGRLPDLRRSEKIDRYINRQLLNFYVSYPGLVKKNESALKDREPLPEDLLSQKREKEKVNSMIQKQSVGKVDEQSLLVVKPNFWKFAGDSYLQFSQNYISKNWYKGGESTKSMLTGFTWSANYDDRRRIQFENKIEWKLGFITAPSDTLHSYKANNDLLRLTSKLGLKAFGTWYYTLSAEFKTQFFSNYETNTDNLVSAFFSPAELNVGLGMDYKFIKDGVCNLSFLMNPINYTLYSVASDRVDPTKFNIKEGHKRESVWGSRVEATLSWTIIKNLTWESRFSYTTNYEKVVGEWENTFTFAFNRFLSTKLFVHGRFDDGVPRVDDHGYLQLQELLSFGLNYTW